MWFGTWGGGVSRFDGSTWTSYSTADGLVHHQVRSLAADTAGHMWVGTAGGLSEFVGPPLRVLLPLLAKGH